MKAWLGEIDEGSNFLWNEPALRIDDADRRRFDLITLQDNFQRACSDMGSRLIGVKLHQTTSTLR